jgi:flagellar protein FlgJ
MQIQQLTSARVPDSGGDAARLKAACQQFEAVFWNQVLDAMRATIPEDGLFGNSFANDVFKGMLFEQYSVLLAGQGSGNGLGDILFRQLSAHLQAPAQQEGPAADEAAGA